MSSYKILLIEDDLKAVNLITTALSLDGHRVTPITDGHAGLLQASMQLWDLLIVDRMLPRIEGLALVKTLREVSVNTPVLFLTALDGIEDRVEGLRAGGDDYLVKRFSVVELLARVEALVRRCHVQKEVQYLQVEDLLLDRMTRSVTRAGQLLALTPREYQILDYMMRLAGQIVTARMLLDNIWNFSFDPGTTVIESHISRLRAKINNTGGELLYTVRGKGYRLGARVV